jgi:Primase X
MTLAFQHPYEATVHRSGPTTMCAKSVSVRNSIDFVLSHFEGQHELFPRTIMTAKTKGQKKIEHETDVQAAKDKVFDYFKQADFKDCKINAFPYNIEHTGVDFEVKNKTAATFIMVDLDLKDFGSRDKLDNQLKKTTNKMSLKFNEAHPTVLWTGNGYHIYQAIDGMIFEKYKVFHDILSYVDKDLTTEFLRFAEKFFSNGRSDSNHLPSIKSCLVRIPGTINSKNGVEVKVIQKWDGKKPAIQWVNEDFRVHLIQKRIDKIREKGRLRQLQVRAPFKINVSNKIGWIEDLLQKPLDDHRKFCLWRILCPYLVNVRKLPEEESAIILKEWLQKCDQLNKLNFNPQVETRHRLRHVGPFLPASKETLKNEHVEIYHIFRAKNIIIE